MNGPYYHEEIIGLTEDGIVFPSKRRGSWTYRLNAREREQYAGALELLKRFASDEQEGELGIAFLSKPEGEKGPFHLEGMIV